jgi:hypothetical protein
MRRGSGRPVNGLFQCQGRGAVERADLGEVVEQVLRRLEAYRKSWSIQVRPGRAAVALKELVLAAHRLVEPFRRSLAVFWAVGTVLGRDPKALRPPR